MTPMFANTTLRQCGLPPLSAKQLQWLAHEPGLLEQFKAAIASLSRPESDEGIAEDVFLASPGFDLARPFLIALICEVSYQFPAECPEVAADQLALRRPIATPPKASNSDSMCPLCGLQSQGRVA